MSGRGLGHTGGTLDKLESIPGLTADLSEEDFIAQVQRIGLAVIGQTEALAPADRHPVRPAGRDLPPWTACR